MTKKWGKSKKTRMKNREGRNDIPFTFIQERKYFEGQEHDLLIGIEEEEEVEEAEEEKDEVGRGERR